MSLKLPVKLSFWNFGMTKETFTFYVDFNNVFKNTCSVV